MANKKWKVKKTLVCKVCGIDVEVRQPTRKTPICEQCGRDMYRRLGSRSKLFPNAWRDIYSLLDRGQKARVVQFYDALSQLVERIG